jgi:hypothetical protein
MEMKDCLFIYNDAITAGGAVDIRSISLKCTDCFFFHNSAGNNGSAVSIRLLHTSTFDYCSFVKNFVRNCSTHGGGAINVFVFTNESGIVSVANNIFYENDFWDKDCDYGFFFL